ncbi:hypothetical protein Sme01_26750 [Sphaerisporangium melleum]|uniref:Uncharacterized protein n=2 Tax=Sphaerisporangium melleum TaxID=321316 RepID=A0A917VFM8_9ACTN|nr:hypothetical protein GCM10007964_12590 [Sphaerisporangium melleum]GII70199.1 hypothetical protein Sme01_26750 [Sphaerisporangium melleum]
MAGAAVERGGLAATLAGAGAVAAVLVLGMALGLARPPAPHPDPDPPVAQGPAEPRTYGPDAVVVTALPSTQPPPSRAEEAHAAELLLADPRLGEVVRDAYAASAGRPLVSARDLRVRSLVFRRHGCQAVRCLQLFVWFPGGDQLDIGRVIVDMNAGSVRVLAW